MLLQSANVQSQVSGFDGAPSFGSPNDSLLWLCPALRCWPPPEAIKVVFGLRRCRLPSAFDLVLNQLKQLRFGLSGPVLPLFDRGLECADAIFGRL
jgi:hypothetical protein